MLSMNDKYYTIHTFSKMLGVTPQTLRNWDKSGKLKPHHTVGNGYRYYSKEQFLSLDVDKKDKVVIGYCRVSSAKQKDDLERQVNSMKQYLIAQGKPFRIIQDIGSGINYNKKGLLELLELIQNHKTNKIVVLYKDRLLRFGFELIETVAKMNDCCIEIIDTTPKTEEQELVEDLVQIIIVFSCKLQGKRAKKTRKMIQDLTNCGTNDD